MVQAGERKTSLRFIQGMRLLDLFHPLSNCEVSVSCSGEIATTVQEKEEERKPRGHSVNETWGDGSTWALLPVGPTELCVTWDQTRDFHIVCTLELFL